jgi:cysteine desulfurase
MRAGTVDVPSIVGLGVACEWAMNHWEKETPRLEKMRDQVIERLLATGEVQLNGHPTERLPNNMSFTFKNMTVDKLLLKLPKVGFSSSSACTSGNTSTSHVLSAIGLSDQEARQTIRFGIGHGTTQDELEYVVERVIKAIEEAKSFHSETK